MEGSIYFLYGRKLFETTSISAAHINQIQDALDNNSPCQDVTDDSGSVTEFLNPRLTIESTHYGIQEDVFIRSSGAGAIAADAFCNTHGFTHSTYTETYPTQQFGWGVLLNESMDRIFNDICNNMLNLLSIVILNDL